MKNFIFLICFLAWSISFASSVTQDEFRQNALITQMNQLLNECKTIKPREFVKRMDRLNVDFIRVIGMKATTKSFRSKKTEVQEIGYVFFAHSLPSGKYDGEAREVISLRDGFGVCAGANLDLLEELAKVTKNQTELITKKQAWSNCMNLEFKYETKFKEKLQSCYNYFVP